MNTLRHHSVFGRVVVFTLLVGGAVAGAWGQIWTEIGDAGDYTTNAQVTAGIGALTRITGSCPQGDHDMYLISITNASLFRAAITAPAGNDTLMGLFDTNGMGIVFNDDTPVPYNGLSTIDFSKNGLPLNNGVFILAMMSSGQMWTSDLGNIWNRQPWDDQRAPDGDGKDMPMTGYWGSPEHAVMDYIIELTGASFAKSGIPPKIDQSPVDLVIDEGGAAAFLVAASGSQPLAFQWQASTNGGSSFSDIVGATNASYSIDAVHPSADNQKKIRVVVSNALGNANSASATLTVNADKIAPAAVFAGTLGHPSAMVVDFSEGVDSVTALDASHYTFPGITITSLTLVSPGRVRLRASAPLGPGTLTVRDIVDRADARNLLAPNPASLVLDTRAHGMTMRKYDGITGTTVDALTTSANFPSTPDSTQYLASLETPSNIDINYGVVVQGYLVPTVTGSYTFYIASDDNGELDLSTDDNPANQSQIAYEPDWDTPRNWLSRPELQSAPQALVAGKKYYLEARMKQGGGDDNLAVTWVKPGETIQSNQPPISSQYLLPFGNVAGGEPVFAQQPKNATVAAGAAVALTALVDGAPPLAYQWYKNGTALPGATQPVLKFNAAYSSSGTYRLGVSNVFALASSSDAVVKVQNPQGVWIEDGDAGDTLTNAQPVVGSGALTQISGTIPDGWDHDLYKFAVSDYAHFSANVTAPEGGDSRLALFDANGKGVVFNDDTSDGGALSAIDYATSKLPAANGIYYLGIMTKAEMPASTVGGTNAYIWTGDNSTTQNRPDGPGAASPLVGFGGYGGSLANYTIALTGAAFLSASVPPVGLRIQISGNNIMMAWPAGSEGDGFTLQETDQVSVPISWQPVATTPVITGSEKTVAIAPSGKAKFYRLSHP